VELAVGRQSFIVSRQYNRQSLIQRIQKDFLIVISLCMPFVIFFTVLASVGFGVFAAYVAVIGILNAFGPASRPEPARPRLVLVPSPNQASGD
jgi:hypothetical protein